MKRSIIIAIILLFVTPVAGARKVRTSRTGISREKTIAEPATDTIIPDPDDIRLSGYDKPLRSPKESVFVTNLTDHDIISFVLTTAYFDLYGRQLHQSVNRIDIQIPAGETRLATYPSWDRQQSFYYFKSKTPKSPAMPYDIRQRIDSLFTTPSTTPDNATPD